MQLVQQTLENIVTNVVQIDDPESRGEAEPMMMRFTERKSQQDDSRG